MKTETRNRIADLEKLGFSLVSTGPRPGVEENRPHIAYGVTIKLNGKEVLTTGYSVGIGFVDIKKAPTQGWSDSEASMILSWKKHPYADFKDKSLQALVASKLARQQKVTPQLDEVLHSLFLDGEPFFDAQSFEDWCGDFGYDPDSRKAEAMWKACDATGRTLAAKIPADVLAKAREIVQDL